MAYTFRLAAVIGPEAALCRLFEPSRRVVVAPLTASLALVPVTRELVRTLRPSRREGAAVGPVPFGRSAASVAIEPGFRWLHAQIALRAADRSSEATVAYVEAEFVGGTGAQSAIVWRDGAPVLGPLHVSHDDHGGSREAVIARVPHVNDWPINRALRELGVVALPGRDAFDTVRLGRHRHLEEWLEVPRRAAG